MKFKDRVAQFRSVSPDLLRSIVSIEDDRATIITVCGLLEDTIGLGLVYCFKNYPPIEQFDELFEGYGPLATFSAKIAVGTVLGLINKDMRHDLGIIKRMRNGSAHSYLPVSFDASPFRERCRSLKLTTNFKDEIAKAARSGTRAKFL